MSDKKQAEQLLANAKLNYDNYSRTIDHMNKNKGMHTNEQMMEKKRLEVLVRKARKTLDQLNNP
jgi:hypothetical protein